MAYTTENTYTGNGSTKKYSFTFPYIAQADILVTIEDANGRPVSTTDWTFANATTIEFTTAPTSGRTIRIYRKTSLDKPAVTFFSGTSIRSGDLNDNHRQLLFSAQESQDNVLLDTGGIITGDMVYVNADIVFEGTTDDQYQTTFGTTDPTADQSYRLPNNSGGGDHTLISSGDSGTVTSSLLNSNLFISNLTVGSLTANSPISGNLAGNATGLDVTAVINSTNQTTISPSDSKFYTSQAADDRFWRQDQAGNEIQLTNFTWSASDTAIATTGAIDARIINLVEDVGGFVPISSELQFPSTNPDINNADGTVVSIGTLVNDLVFDISGNATITNGAGSGVDVFIVNGPQQTTIAQGNGAIVETTSSTHTYTWHRTTPDVTNVNTLANSITNINAVGNSIANVNTVAGNLTNINTVAGISSDVTTVAGVGTQVGLLGTADAVSDMNTLATTAIVADMDTLADIAADITTLAHIEDGTDATDAIQTVASNVNNITTILADINDVSTVASNISDVTTVAGISSNVTTVAGISSDVTTVANNISSINTKLPLSGGTMTGNITFNSTQTFDGRDVSADGAVIDSLATVATSGSYNDLSNTPTIPTNNNQLTNGAGYITSFDITTQTDSKYLRSDTGDTAAGDILFTGGAGAINIGAGSCIHATNGTWAGNHVTNAGKIQLSGNNWYLQSSGGIIWRDSSNTNHQVLTTSDEGSGNGLDADTVDTLHASSFLRSDATDTKTAGFTTFNDSCSIKVGTNEDLEIYSTGSDVYFILDNSCDLHIQSGGVTKYKFDTTGDLELNDLVLDGRFTTGTGNCGIGTAYPDYKLDVKSANSNTAEVVAAFGNATIQSALQIDTNGNLDWGLNARNNRSLTFKTNQTERMRITGMGYVGIGTSSPDQAFQIEGQGSQYAAITSTDSGNTGILFGDTDIDAGYILYANGSDALTLGANAAERMRIASDGNVGIGTNSPSEKLDVAGHIKVDSGPTLSQEAGNGTLRITSPTGFIAIGSGNTSFAHFYTDRAKYYFDEPIVQHHGQFSSYSTNDLKLFTNTLTEERLRIVQSTGYVGIGTSTPSHLLEVESATPSDTGGIRVSNLPYSHSQDKPFLIAGTSGWTGANTNWNTFGWQFKIKSDSGGVAKMTIDVAAGGNTIEGLNILTHGRVGLSGADMFQSWSTYANDLVVGNTSSNDTGVSIVSSPDSASRGSLYFADAAGGGGNYAGFIDYYHNTDALRFGTASTERVRINSSGQVGIGTSNPTYGLHVNSTGYFENQLSMTAPIQFNGTLDTYDAPGGSGTDTASDVAIALASGHKIVGQNTGYIRTLLEWNSTSDIQIGQGNTNMIGGINLMPGTSGLAKVNGSQITTNKQFLGATNDGTTGAWHITDSNVTAYTDNMCVALFTNGIAGISGGTTLEINSLGAKNIYYQGDAVLTTHYGPETLIMLIYTAAEDRWYAHDFYYVSDDYRVRWQNDVTAGSLITGYQLLMEGVDGKMYPVTTPSASTPGNTKAVQTAELRVNGLMLHYESSTDIAANGTLTGNYIYSSVYASTMEYWHNYDAGWATPYRPWYLVCTKNSNGNFVLDNSSLTSFVTQTLPTSDDGKYYIMGGWMHNNHDAYRLQVDHPIYVYKNGGVVQWSQYSESSGSSSSTTAGSVIETLAGMCDGRQVTVGSGTYTLDTADHSQVPSTTYVDLSGSEISYTPPSGTNQVIYDFEYQASYYATAAPLWHTKFYVDSDEVTAARFSRYNYYDDRARIRVVLSLNNGTADIANGKLGTWTSAKTLKLQIRAYHVNYRPHLHSTHYFDGGSSAQSVVPTLTITAIA